MWLTPHVYWAQRHEDIYLRVELIDAQVGRVMVVVRNKWPSTPSVLNSSYHVYFSSSIIVT